MKRVFRHIILVSILNIGTVCVSLSQNGKLNSKAEFSTVTTDSLPDAGINSSAEVSIVNGQSILKVCSNKTAEVTFTNISSTLNNNKNYSINWGDGSTVFNDSIWSLLTHNYAIGFWTLTYTVTSKNGASVTNIYNVYVGSNPAVALGSPGNTDNCSNVPLTFPISGTENNPPGTTYTVTFNDGSNPQVFTHPAPAEITHTFTKSSCGITSYNGKIPYVNSFSASIVASNACGVSAVNVVPIYISTSPVVDFLLQKTITATNAQINISNTTTGYVNVGANCSIVPKIVWIITPSTGFTLKSGTLGNDFGQDNSNLWQNGTDIISPVFNTPGKYNIKLRVDTKRCGNDVIEKTVYVEGPLTPQFSLDVNSGCTPVAVNAVNQTDLSSSFSSTTAWDVTYSADNCGNAPAEWSFANGTTKSSSNPSFNFVTPGIYKIILSMTNSCGTYTKEQTVVVKKRPTATIEAIPDFCGTASFTPKATVSNCNAETGSLSYSWSFPGGNPSTSDKLNPGVIVYNSTGTYNTSLTVTNECGSVTSTSNNFSVNVLPFVNDVASQLKNNKQLSDGIFFTGSDETVYSWTNDNTKIGLAVSGTGNINPFTVQNSGKSVIIANITVTPKNSKTSCVGLPKTFSISVNPSADVNQPANQTISNGASSLAVLFSTANSGGTTTYQWTNDTPTIGLAASGISNIDSFTAINTTNAPIVATLTVTPTFENAGLITTGTSKSFTITVNPTATMNQPTDIEICNGTTTADLVFTSIIGTGTLKYNWTNDNKSIGLAETGVGSIKGFKAINTDTIAHVATITVTPVYTYNGVSNSGLPQKFTIKVNPAAVITTQPQSSSICRGGKVTPLKVIYANGVGVPTYQWFSNTTNSTIAGTLILDATTDTYLPQSMITGTTYYYCIITFAKGVCSSITSDVATISVNNAAVITINPIVLQNICVGGTIENPLKVEFNGGTGTPTYQWYFNTVNSKTDAKLVNGATTATFKPTAFNETGHYFYFVEISMSGDGCGSVFSDIAEVNVVADPIVVNQPLTTQTICQGTKSKKLSVQVTGGLGNYNYQWYENTVNDNSTGKLIVGAVSDEFLPSTEKTGTMYYYCLITQENGLNCAVCSSTAIVIVNQIPVITKNPASKSLCQGDKPDSLSVSYNYGVGLASYQWYSNSTNSTSNGSIISGATKPTYVPLADVLSKTYYYCVISFETGGISKIVSDAACITVNPIAVISKREALICSGTSFSVIPVEQNGDIVPENTTYTWSNPIQSPSNSVLGANLQSIPVSEISQKLFNQTDSIATVIYTVTPVTGSCFGESFKVTVKVYPMIKPNAIVKNVSCHGANNGSIQTNISGGVPFNKVQKYEVTWTGPTDFTSKENDISGLQPGDYTISISDEGGCPVSYTYTISEPYELKINTDLKRDINCYNSQNGQISVTVSGGTPPYKFNWTKDGLAFATTDDISNLDQGVYSLQVTDANGCDIKTASYSISEPTAILINILSQQNNSCFNDSIGSVFVKISGGTPFDLNTATSEYSYFWTGPNGFTSKSKNLSNLPAGKFQLTVTDANACSQTLVVEITQPNELLVKVTTKLMTCYQSNDASISLEINGGTKPYLVKWNNMGSGSFQENLDSGDYTAIITDANNCQKSIKVNIPEANFVIHPLIKNVTCFGAHDGSIDLNITGGVNPVTLVWDDNPNAGNKRNQLEPGIYSVTIRDGAPCNIRETFMISEPQQIYIQSKIVNAFDCDNPNSGSISLTVTGGTPPYSYQWSNGSDSLSLRNIPKGKYAVIITDSKGCSQSAQYEIIRQAPLTVSLNAQNVLDFDNSRVAKRFIANVSGGFAPYQLHWNNGVVEGVNNEIMRTSQSTVAELQVTDSIGCTLNYSFNIVITDIGISYEAIDCSKSRFQFNSKSAILEENNYSYLWDFGDGEISNARNPIHNYKKNGEFNVQLIISNGISSSSFQTVVYVNLVTRLRLDKEPKFCVGDSVIVYAKGAASYKWCNGSIDDHITIKTADDYSVIGTTIEGCKDTLYFSSGSYDVYTYSIITENNEKVPEDSEVQFWSESIPYSAYHWDFGDGTIEDGNRVSHKFKMNQLGFYDIKLNVVNPNGCTEYATKRIWIKTPIDMPNTFTPNGDGINDLLLKGWQIKLFNRNGILLYEGNDGWDGNYKGQAVSSGVYYYQIFYPSGSGIKSESGYVRVVR